MSDLDALFVTIERDLADATNFLVAADWCDENGKPDTAYALRWCAADGFRPFFRPDVKRRPWEWMRYQKSYQGMTKTQVKARGAAAIPAALFDAMPCDDKGYIASFKSLNIAIFSLADGLKELRDITAYSDLPEVVVKPTKIQLVCCRQCGISRAAFAAECGVCKSKEVVETTTERQDGI